MKIFETHAHLYYKDFDADRDKLIADCQKEGVEYIINIGVDQKSSEQSIELAKKYDIVYATVGYHPQDVKYFDEQVLRKLLKKKKVVAIGEIGLDYYRNHSPKKVQQKAFEQQVQIAVENNMPMVIHDREAHEDCFDILKNAKAKDVVFHCFSGDIPFAEKVLSEDWIISFTGIITYKKSGLDDLVRMVPSDMFFIETDCPYLSPVPKRGKRNSPLNLIYIIQKIADLRCVTPKMVALKSYENAYKFFFKNS